MTSSPPFTIIFAKWGTSSQRAYGLVVAQKSTRWTGDADISKTCKLADRQQGHRSWCPLRHQHPCKAMRVDIIYIYIYISSVNICWKHFQYWKHSQKNAEHRKKKWPKSNQLQHKYDHIWPPVTSNDTMLQKVLPTFPAITSTSGCH